MNQKRDEMGRGRLVTLAAAGFLETSYLAILFSRNASAFRVGRTAWLSDLARESGTAGVIWLILVASAATWVGTLLTRRQTISLLLVLAILAGCLAIESLAIVERIKFKRMGESMSNLRQTGLKILEEAKSSTSGLPLHTPTIVAASLACRDGWGHPLRFVRISPNHAFLIAPGSDDRIEANVETIKREVFPPARFDHDIIVEIAEGEVRFVVYPNGPEQGIPCTLYSALGCLSYWR